MKYLEDLKIGDTVTRMLCGTIPMELKVTAIDDLIHCGPWTFSRRNGAEIDEEIGSSETLCASFIKLP